MDNKEIVALIKRAYVAGFIDGFDCTNKDFHGKDISVTSKAVQEIIREGWDREVNGLVEDITKDFK